MHIAWGDAPTWLAVIVATFGGWIALRQLRQQGNTIKGEIERNKARDELLDAELREQMDRERSRQREQAEGVDLTWVPGDPVTGRSAVVVANNSTRPIRQVTAVIQTGNAVPPSRPVTCAVMVSNGFGHGWTIPPHSPTQTHIAVLRRGEQATFEMALAEGALGGMEVRAQFIDDAGYRWQLTNDLSLSLSDET